MATQLISAFVGQRLVQLLVTLGVAGFAAEATRQAATTSPRWPTIEGLVARIQSFQPYHFPTSTRRLADELHVAIASPSAVNVEIVSGQSRAEVQAAVVNALLARAAAPGPIPPLTPFPSVSEADSLMQLVDQLAMEGGISQFYWQEYQEHYERERSRLLALAPEDWIGLGQTLAADSPSPDTLYFVGRALANAGMLRVPNPESFLDELPGSAGRSWDDALAWYRIQGLIGVAAPPAVPTPSVPAEAPVVPAAASPLAVPGLAAIPGLIAAINAHTLALPGALSQAMTGAANLTNGQRQRQHLDRLACMPTTALTMGQKLTAAALGLVVPFGMLAVQQAKPGALSPMKIIVENLAKTAIPSTLITPDNVDDFAMDLLADRTAFGAAAHLLAQAAEVNGNIKHMGAGYLAAFLADLSGYGRLAAAWLGQVEQQAVQPAMARRVNRITQAQIPRSNDLGVMYAKKEVTPQKTADTLAELGYDRFWQDTWLESLFLDPRLGEIVRVGQFYALSLSPETSQPTPAALHWLTARQDWLKQADVTLQQIMPDWWLWYKFMKGGYEMTDVKVLVQVAKRAIVRREQSLFFNAVLRLYRDGYITRPKAEELVGEGWGVGTAGQVFLDPIQARMRAMDLQVEYNRKAMVVGTVGRMLAKGFLGEDEAVRLMVGQGMAENVAVARIVQAKLGLLPTRRLELGEGEDGEVGESAEAE